MDTKITVKNREQKGSSHARRLRREGWVPGVIYSEGSEARSVSLPKHEFELMLHHHASEHVMIQIQIDGGKEESVLLKDVQHDALTGSVMHVDLQEVALNKKLRVEVPVELVGDAVGVLQGGVLEHLLHSIEIECLPADIPEKVNVDVSRLGIGDMLFVKDILPDLSKFKILIDEDIGVAAVSEPKVIEEETAEGEGGAEPEVIRENKDEEAE
ncbi:MAG: large subunit ribosomal protein [Verrucomicrobiota bacterium]|jgi:large subunit ribosomal protein L25|nr:large subunit ribosomal protein [Verrucomicrobiota bacterium]MDK2963092.1 large subunit ribosomal protein [Verrucomicrobiota bacterium]